MYKIKQKPEDFIVDEVSDIELQERGDYIVFELKKTNYTTERAIQRICESLHIPRKKVGYAGSKDKMAVTSQYISLFKINKEKIERLKLKDIELTFKGYSDKPISLGDLKGNRF
ncbi:MAG: tRNA pseudouridine(13) synthase TruD, partial [archaeon]